LERKTILGRDQDRSGGEVAFDLIKGFLILFISLKDHALVQELIKRMTPIKKLGDEAMNGLNLTLKTP